MKLGKGLMKYFRHCFQLIVTFSQLTHLPRELENGARWEGRYVVCGLLLVNKY